MSWQKLLIMQKKHILLLFLISFFTLVAFLIIKNKTSQPISEQKNTNKKVSTIECKSIKKQSVSPLIEFSGRITSSNKINIISEVNGVSKIENTKFEVGEYFKKGDVLLSIEDSDIALELKSIKSQFLALLIKVLPDIKMDFPSLGSEIEFYVNNFNLNNNISDLPKITHSKARNFLSSRQVFSNYYTIKSLEKKIEKFKIRAPFEGVLTRVLIDPGSSIIIGQPLGEFINPKMYEINGSVSINDSKLIQPGNEVIIYSNDLNSKIKGVVDRIGCHINELTQSVDVFILVKDSTVKDGMYVTGNIVCDTINNIFKIERSRITKKNQVYTVLNNELKLKNVDIIVFQNDSVIVDGLLNKDCIVTQYRNYFYDNMPIN